MGNSSSKKSDGSPWVWILIVFLVLLIIAIIIIIVVYAIRKKKIDAKAAEITSKVKSIVGGTSESPSELDVIISEET